ncbi:MAG: LysR family transcriptional regulator [Amaricoccus sp.]
MDKEKRGELGLQGQRFVRNLDWNLLKFFHEISEARSVTGAARELNRKQPALSLALRRLEDRLGVRLCERGAHGFELTDEGQMLAETCRGFSEVIREIPHRLTNVAAEVRGTLRVSMVSNLVDPALDDALAAFHADHPAVEIILQVEAWTDVINALMQHRADIGVAPSRVHRAELAYVPLFTEVHRPYCGRGHPRFGMEVAEPAELANDPFVLTGADEGDELTQFRLEHGLGRIVAGASAHLEEAKRLAILGVGVCFLPEGYAQPEVVAGKLWPLVEAAIAPRTEMFIITDPGAPRHAAREVFLAEIARLTAAA